MTDHWEEENDIISKLLSQHNDLTTTTSSSKSLRDEFVEVGVNLTDISSMHSSQSYDSLEDVQEEVLYVTSLLNNVDLNSGREKKELLKTFNLSNFMNEFQKLSKVMDEQITNTSKKLQVAEEEKLKFDPIEQGKVSILRELLQEQQKKMIEVEKEYEILLKTKGNEFLKQIGTLKNALNQQEIANKELQMEFNKVLDEKENEVQHLSIENTELTNELTLKEDDIYDLGMENEELEDKFEIKDNFIATLKLQVKNLEKQHEQDEWKLQQANDLLEMVEREQEKMEQRYKGIIAKLKKQVQFNKSKESNHHGFKRNTNLDSTQSGSKSHFSPSKKIITRSSSCGVNMVPSNINKPYETMLRRNKRSSSNILNESKSDVPQVLRALGWGRAYSNRIN